MLTLAALAVSTCQKENLRENEVTPVPGKQIKVTVNGLMGEYQVADATKADLVNTVRVAWTGGEQVYAYTTSGLLGTLTASLEGTEDRYAKLSGTLSDPGDKTVTLVYSPQFTEAPSLNGAKISLDLSEQDGAKVPFVVFGTLDSKDLTVSNVIVPFKFATSVMKVNCTGLSKDVEITKATVNNLSTVCELTFKADAAPEVAGKALGTITRKGTGAFSSSDSRAIFQLALVATEAAKPSERVLTVSQDKDYVADFSACALASGKSYNSVYAMSPAPTFKAVYNTTGGANTLTFYFDAEDHSSEGTVYEGSTGDYYLCHDNIFASSSRWGYDGIRNSIKGVVFDESVAGYHGLTSTGFMFSDFKNTASISGEELLDVSNVTDMRSMFGGVGVSVNPFNEVLNISGWNTSKVQNLNNMFLNYGRNLTNFTLDLSGWDVTNVTTATDMFKQSGYSSTSWSVTIPAKTTLKAGGEKANTASEWYMGDGTTTVEPNTPITGIKGTFIIIPEGALKGVFSVSATKKVLFSKGNLHCSRTSSSSNDWAWHFYNDQYGYNSNNKYCDEYGSRSASESDTEIDLFTWGYSASTSLNPVGESYVTSYDEEGGVLDYEKPSSAGGDDWGVAYCESNEIAAGTWRTLTTEEWQYLFSYDGSGAGGLDYDNETRRNKYKYCVTVCDKPNCVVLLPDVWDETVISITDFTNTTEYSETTAPKWSAMEAAGAVCLPAAGLRAGSGVYFVGDNGFYWSSSAAAGCAYEMYFDSSQVKNNSNTSCESGKSVRLVTDVK